MGQLRHLQLTVLAWRTLFFEAGHPHAIVGLNATLVAFDVSRPEPGRAPKITAFGESGLHNSTLLGLMTYVAEAPMATRRGRDVDIVKVGTPTWAERTNQSQTSSSDVINDRTIEQWYDTRNIHIKFQIKSDDFLKRLLQLPRHRSNLLASLLQRLAAGLRDRGKARQFWP